MRWTHFQTPRNSCVSALNCIILISDEADDNYRTDGDTNDESDGRTPLEKMLKMEIALRKLKKCASKRAPLSPPRSD